MNQPSQPESPHPESAHPESPQPGSAQPDPSGPAPAGEAASQAPSGEPGARPHRPARRSESEALGYGPEDHGPEAAGTDPFAALSGTLGGGGFDMGSLLAQAQQMQANLMAAKAEADATECEGEAGGGAVVICATGDWEFTSVTIKPEVIDADDPGMLEDLVLVALRDLAAEIADLQSESMGGLPGIGGMPDMGG